MRFVSRGNQRQRILLNAHSERRLKRRYRLWIFWVGIILVLTVVGVGALLKVNSAEKYSVVLLPTEEGPKLTKVAVHASETFILGKPEVDSSRVQKHQNNSIANVFSLLSDEVLLCQKLISFRGVLERKYRFTVDLINFVTRNIRQTSNSSVNNIEIFLQRRFRH